jgi:hypothetical protein
MYSWREECTILNYSLGKNDPWFFLEITMMVLKFRKYTIFKCAALRYSYQTHRKTVNRPCLSEMLSCPPTCKHMKLGKNHISFIRMFNNFNFVLPTVVGFVSISNLAWNFSSNLTIAPLGISGTFLVSGKWSFSLINSWQPPLSPVIVSQTAFFSSLFCMWNCSFCFLKFRRVWQTSF